MVILSQTDGANNWYFQYDTNGTPIGFIYNGTQYFYLTNQFGDVFGITDDNGNQLVTYTYDEWGYVKRVICGRDEEKLANSNPIRYRGYYYDTETGYYYLQSRYYDPSICRFINSDAPEIAQESTEDINGLNLFIYCCEDPVNNVDFDGYKYNPIKAKAYADKWWNKKMFYIRAIVPIARILFHSVFTLAD